MPYIKGRGVRDLYLIRIARIGSKAEVHKYCDDKNPRSVFDLEFTSELDTLVSHLDFLHSQ